MVVKPPGVLVQADRTGDADLLSRLKADLKQRHGKPGNVYLGLVHRLDRPVGGIMVFAKTSKAASRLAAQIRARTFKKTYLAWVHGCPHPESGRLEHCLKKESRSNTVRVVPSSDSAGKPAALEYSVIERRRHAALVRIDLITGRPHQIRVQMASIGCPLLGDRKYGNPDECPDECEIALWAHEIRFSHPTTRAPLSFTAPLPPEWDMGGTMLR